MTPAEKAAATRRHRALVAADAREALRLQIAELRQGPDCPHGERGGRELHPTSGLPLCPLCRVRVAAR